jgi:hypothetical protein
MRLMRLNPVVVVMLVASSGFGVAGCGSDTTGPSSPPSVAAKPWAHSAGGSINDYGAAVAVDGSGNAVVAGSFADVATFGTTMLTSSGGFDAFVAKYDAEGTFQWARGVGGTGGDFGYSVAVDGSGNVVLVGTFTGSAVFGVTTLTSAGGSDIFVVKYDAGGAVQWVRAAGGTSSDLARGVAIDGFGNVIVTGTFQGSATFGAATFTSAGGRDIFLAEYNAAGTVSWVLSAGGANDDDVAGVAADGSGNVALTGTFQGSATFGATTITSAGGSDAFVARYDAVGNLAWAHSAGGADSESGSGVAIDKSGNVVVTGYFGGTATFGGTTLTSAGAYDVFVARYNAAGALLWARSAGGPVDDDTGNGVAVDGSGNVAVTGSFGGVATFGATTRTSAGAADVFVARYNAAGTLTWVHRAGGVGDDSGSGVAVDKSGNVIVAGTFEDGAVFGTTTLPNAGGNDVFIARVSSSGF